jgi:branched-chain amino acid aminotransferase
MRRLWHNDGLVAGKLALSADDRGLTLGDGVFETLAVTDGVALWRFEHIERMRAAAQLLGIRFPESRVEDALDALTSRLQGHHVLRLTLTRGDGARGLAGDTRKPTLIGTLQPFDLKLRFRPATVVISSVRRNLDSPASRLKTTSYVDNILAAREAQAKGVDEALMLNSASRVACCSIGNVFLVREDILVTPSLAEGILPGVMRASVIQLAKAAGIAVRERQVRPRELTDADAMFVTNSLRFLRPVTTCDGKRFLPRSKVIDQLVRGLLNMEQQQLILD